MEGLFRGRLAPIARPRLLLVPTLTQIEWRIKPLLEEWAEVTCFDMPGVGDEPPADHPGREALIARGVEQLERVGWESCVIVGDEFGVFSAVPVAAVHPERVAGLALGHACLKVGPDSLNGEVMSAFMSLAEVDYRTYARHLTQITQDAYDDETADEYIRRIPQQVSLDYLPQVAEATGEDLEPILRDLGRPLLFAEHEGCLGWTAEGYKQAVAAFPEAMTVSTTEKCSVSPAFAEALRDFCAGLDWD